MAKWITDYRHCTVSFIECKLRGVKKEDGYVNKMMEPVIDINRTDVRRIVYIFVFLVLLINLYRLGIHF